MNRPFLYTLSVAVLLAAAGCGGTDTAVPADDRPPAAAGGSYSAKDVCAYLKGEIPALREVGSPVGRHANLAGKLATFFESHGKPENGAVLDAATKAECPAVRTDVLTLIDVDSFASF
ncbi:hypothetical protein ACIBSW_18060 [Actinoplanes sp. NPDC049668]|uniref:hypothetical protein n=1 Tax=unclassified Actinoplanes TaxID=2626549 RepID=UPI0033B7F329